LQAAVTSHFRSTSCVEIANYSRRVKIHSEQQEEKMLAAKQFSSIARRAVASTQAKRQLCGLVAAVE
jgi:hypothetical protein